MRNIINAFCLQAWKYFDSNSDIKLDNNIQIVAKILCPHHANRKVIMPEDDFGFVPEKYIFVILLNLHFHRKLEASTLIEVILMNMTVIAEMLTLMKRKKERKRAPISVMFQKGDISKINAFYVD